MNRPKTQMPRRLRMPSAKVARTAKEAAISLVRLEFDAARLRQGIEQARNRTESYEAELHRNAQERQHLVAVLSQTDAAHDPDLRR